MKHIYYPSGVTVTYNNNTWSFTVDVSLVYKGDNKWAS